MLNIGLDLWFVIGLEQGAAGAAEATVIAQYVSGIGITVYALLRVPCLKISGEEVQCHWQDKQVWENWET